MAASRSDALLLFGVTGDLAHKMIFPALYAMVKRGDLKVPIIGVAFPKWSLERLHRRVTWKASLVPDLASSACVKSRRSASRNCRYAFAFRARSVPQDPRWKLNSRSSARGNGMSSAGFSVVGFQRLAWSSTLLTTAPGW
jgi:hypothetical protein